MLDSGTSLPSLVAISSTPVPSISNIKTRGGYQSAWQLPSQRTSCMEEVLGNNADDEFEDATRIGNRMSR
eukprot:758456-Hanusia_phi.AAC.2